MESAETLPRPQKVLTLEEALARADRNYQRLIEAGGPAARDIEGRLAWKRARGVDTTLEEQFCGLEPR